MKTAHMVAFFVFVFGCGALGYIDARRADEAKELESWRELGVAIKKPVLAGTALASTSSATWSSDIITVQCTVCGRIGSSWAMASHHCEPAPICSSCNGSGRAK